MEDIKNNVKICLDVAEDAKKNQAVYDPHIDLPTDCKESAVNSGNFSLLEENLQGKISHIYSVIKRAKEMQSIAREIHIRIKEHVDNSTVKTELEKVFFQEFEQFYTQLKHLEEEIGKLTS